MSKVPYCQHTQAPFPLLFLYSDVSLLGLSFSYYLFLSFSIPFFPTPLPMPQINFILYYTHMTGTWSGEGLPHLDPDEASPPSVPYRAV